MVVSEKDIQLRHLNSYEHKGQETLFDLVSMKSSRYVAGFLNLMQVCIASSLIISRMLQISLSLQLK